MLILKLHPQIQISEKKDGTCSLRNRDERTGKELVVKNSAKTLVQTLKHLKEKGAAEESLADLAAKEDPEAGLTSFYYFLSLLKQHNLLSYSLSLKGKELLRIIPFSRDFSVEKTTLPRKVRLSKFACIRTTSEGLIIETPLAAMQCKILDREVVQLLHTLATEKPTSKIKSNFPRPFLDTILSLLFAVQILTDDREEKDPALIQWEFHDLYFHSRVRLGRHANPYGGVYPFKGKIAPLPVCKPPLSKKPISLFRPDIEKLKKEDVSLTHALETRRSKRDPGNVPITLKQLGEFLFRTARIKDLIPEATPQELSRRLYPGGGAIYELELYIVSNSCKDLNRGIYHYDPKNHALHPLEADLKNVEKLILDAKGSMAAEKPPQLLIIIASRFQRLAWKYRSIPYAITLKNCGTLIQTMYLVATAMNLSPCAVGGGSSDLFSRTTSLPYLTETSVAEFSLSS
jgi:SagB-type dehydrogenase family enzyme